MAAPVVAGPRASLGVRLRGSRVVRVLKRLGVAARDARSLRRAWVLEQARAEGGLGKR